ncbi:MAG TPA: hypothetical protein VF006_06140 [Longimicrobium sp.]
MNAPPVIAALIAAASAVFVAALTYFLTKRREHETEWRQFKLEYYRENVLALSEITEKSITAEGQRRFAIAANNLSLVAPPEVLEAVYAVVDDMNNPARTEQSAERSLSAFFRRIRQDSHPAAPDDAGISFKLFSGPAPAPAAGDGSEPSPGGTPMNRPSGA